MNSWFEESIFGIILMIIMVAGFFYALASLVQFEHSPEITQDRISHVQTGDL